MTRPITAIVLLAAAFVTVASGGALLPIVPMVGFGLLVAGGAIMGVVAGKAVTKT